MRQQLNQFIMGECPHCNTSRFTEQLLGTGCWLIGLDTCCSISHTAAPATQKEGRTLSTGSFSSLQELVWQGVQLDVSGSTMVHWACQELNHMAEQMYLRSMPWTAACSHPANATIPQTPTWFDKSLGYWLHTLCNTIVFQWSVEDCLDGNGYEDQDIVEIHKEELVDHVLQLCGLLLKLGLKHT